MEKNFTCDISHPAFLDDLRVHGHYSYILSTWDEPEEEETELYSIKMRTRQNAPDGKFYGDYKYTEIKEELSADAMEYIIERFAQEAIKSPTDPGDVY